MRQANPKLPLMIEWDFRKADPLLLREAAAYEYARTSEKMRKTIVQWLETKSHGKTIRESIFDAGIRSQQISRQTRLDDFAFPPGAYSVGKQLLPEGAVYFYAAMLKHRPDFPDPWTKVTFTGKLNDRFSRLKLRPMGGEFGAIKCDVKRAKEWPKGWEDYFEFRSKESPNTYKLEIGFAADGRLSTVDEIVSDFEKWLRAEVKRTKPKMRAGRNSQLEQTAYPLKCLAAYRISRAGFTFDEAQAALSRARTVYKFSDNDLCFIPIFNQAASWTKAVRYAENTLASIESVF